MYPHTYYKVLMPTFEETGERGTGVDYRTGRGYEIRWQAVFFTEVGIAESMADAKAKFPYLRNPILEPVGFKPTEYEAPKPHKVNGVTTYSTLLERENAFA